MNSKMLHLYLNSVCVYVSDLHFFLYCDDTTTRDTKVSEKKKKNLFRYYVKQISILSVLKYNKKFIENSKIDKILKTHKHFF